ncbi:hypothetical protein C1645_746860 [Glomus cerebriforme]|uniref:Uncharacterized protein n=1 Tax=Glomus cerebriforme TaxID=658196 RepID=A0A397TQG0_9GLOM|nr:hypothetical protein C1645_746860 [Glomus cerebriforme]
MSCSEGKNSVNKNIEKQVHSSQRLKTLDHKHRGINFQKVLDKFYQENIVEVDPQLQV